MVLIHCILLNWRDLSFGKWRHYRVATRFYNSGLKLQTDRSITILEIGFGTG
jgi:hypothetical protein